MSISNSENKDTVFNTPNPAELKQAAQQDPIQEREEYGNEGEVIDERPNDEERGRDTATDLANSQVTVANLGGH